MSVDEDACMDGKPFCRAVCREETQQEYYRFQRHGAVRAGNPYGRKRRETGSFACWRVSTRTGLRKS